MSVLGSIKGFLNNWKRSLTLRSIRSKKAFNKCLIYNGLSNLNEAKVGTHIFVGTLCDEKLAHRLLEMGFVPEEKIAVLANSGRSGSVIVKVKGAKIALSNKIAKNILLKGKNLQ
ncbi:MAG: ferrous iron transport protein A [Endomicrobium sp.]|jgi:Fe2+ transport system protein FeoA|nr:ferrous iron transport protein A [Endomicrobium sp.]